jgi:methyl-accepting chemotaxis protein
MNNINKSAGDIKNVVKVIDDIAFQTNLLALNADIEAARVGKYGKGFAVVANSVRNLALRSSESVKQTTSMVENAINNINLGVTLVEKTAEKLNEITVSSIEVSNLTKEVADSNQEQARGIEQISTALSSIEEVVQSNSANAEENSASSEELASQSKGLKDFTDGIQLSDNVKERIDTLFNNGNGNGKKKSIAVYEKTA